MARHWIWKSVIASLCGSIAHSLLMLLKSQTGLLPAFQPYESLQRALGLLVGAEGHPIVPWILSYVSGATVVGFLFHQSYRQLPGKFGALKGLAFGLFAWLLMGLLFFPIVGLGFFATQIGQGIAPALFSLAMLLTYGVVMGAAYAAFDLLP
jgi:hypothetical protein